MKSQVLSNFQWIDLTVIAFIIFITFFIAVLYWTFRKGSRDLYKEIGQLPLSEATKAGEQKHE